MTAQDVGSVLLMAAGAALLVVASVGACLPRSAVVRLHYLSLGAMAGARLGVPVGPARLTPIVGAARAKDLIYTGRTIGMVEAVRETGKRFGEKLEVRIGIHSGEVVAGWRRKAAETILLESSMNFQIPTLEAFLR